MPRLDPPRPHRCRDGAAGELVTIVGTLSVVVDGARTTTTYAMCARCWAVTAIEPLTPVR